MEASRTGTSTLCPTQEEAIPQLDTAKRRSVRPGRQPVQEPHVDPAHGSGVTNAQGGSSVEGAGQLSRPVWAALIVGGKATS